MRQEWFNEEYEDKDFACVECDLLHCDYYHVNNGKVCPHLKNKLKNKFKKLQNHVYHHLRLYGNGVIAQDTYDKLGKETIKKDLESNGFKNVYVHVNENGVIVTADKEMSEYERNNRKGVRTT